MVLNKFIYELNKAIYYKIIVNSNISYIDIHDKLSRSDFTVQGLHLTTSGKRHLIESLFFVIQHQFDNDIRVENDRGRTSFVNEDNLIYIDSTSDCESDTINISVPRMNNVKNAFSSMPSNGTNFRVRVSPIKSI